MQLRMDLGSRHIRIACLEKNISYTDSAVVALDASNRIAASGVAAKKLRQRDNVRLAYPIHEGCVVSEELAETLFRQIAAKAGVSWNRSKLLLATSLSLNSGDKAVLEGIFNRLGVKQTIFREGVTADFRLAQRLYGVTEGVIVNVGAGCSEIALLRGDSIVNGCSLYLAGNAIDAAIQKYAEFQKGVRISAEEAEAVKMNCGSLYSNDMSVYTASGVSAKTGEAASVTIAAREIYDTVEELTIRITDVVKSLMNSIPNSDECEVFLTGGSSYLQGLDSFVEQQLQRNITVLPDPDESTLNGLKLMPAEKEEKSGKGF